MDYAQKSPRTLTLLCGLGISITLGSTAVVAYCRIPPKSNFSNLLACTKDTFNTRSHTCVPCLEHTCSWATANLIISQLLRHPWFPKSSAKAMKVAGELVGWTWMNVKSSYNISNWTPLTMRNVWTCCNMSPILSVSIVEKLLHIIIHYQKSHVHANLGRRWWMNITYQCKTYIYFWFFWLFIILISPPSSKYQMQLQHSQMFNSCQFVISMWGAHVGLM